jgi:single-strand DNA-binding protein
MAFALLTAGGNLGSDPESRYTQNGTFLLEFSLAVNTGGRNDQNPPTWYRCTAWDALAERMDKLVQQGYIAKGSSLIVTGNFKPRPYQDRDGRNRVSLDVTLTDFQFMGSGQRQQEQPPDQQQVPGRSAPVASHPANHRGHQRPQPPASASPSLRDVPF